MKNYDELSDTEKKIYAVLTKGDASYLNLCVPILEIIKGSESENKGELLRFLFENIELISSDKAISPDHKLISDLEEKELSDKYEKISDEMLNSLIKRNLEEDEFYDETYKVITNPYFSEKNSQPYVLYNILTNNKIPYFFMENGMKMNEEKYKELSINLYIEFAKLRFIVNRGSEQRTQTASNLLDIINKYGGEEQVVIVAQIVSLYERKIARIARAYQNSMAR